MKKSMWFKNNLPKIKASLTVFVIVLAFFVSNLQAARAVPMPTVTTADVPKTIRDIVTDIWAKTKDLFGKAGEKAFNATLSAALNRIAFDAAKYVGTAGEGQKPLFVTEGLNTYLTNLGDAAAGDFIDSLGKTWAIDLCQPADPALKARIGLGLIQSQRPQAPNCTLSQLTSNYSSAYEKYAAMKSGDYLKGILASVDPGGSEISASLELFNRTEQAKTAAAETAKTDQIIKGGWLDVRNISGKTSVPPGTAKADLASAQAKADAAFVQMGNDPWISAANIFLNQLALEAFQRAQRELAKGKSTTIAYDYSRPQDLFTSVVDYGIAVVNEKLSSVIKPRFDVKSDYSVLSELATCQDKTNPGPNNCVIDDNFSQAISEKLTVAEALDKGYLHGDWLISNNDKLENTYTLRSFSILRKFRVIPVGWEQAIITASKNNYQAKLMDLVACFNPDDKYDKFSDVFDKSKPAWCQGLVDPSWVLKTPLGVCRKQGAGGQILSSFSIVNSPSAGGASSVAISRNTNYCADEQTCIKEKNDGSCEVYGYCNEEKRTWNFDSDTCEPIYNTCQTFINSSNNQTASYLENTLDYGACNASNAGCKQYVYGGIYDDTSKQVAWDKKYSIYFNNQVASCNSKDEGCTTLLRGKPGWGNVNYVMNSDFSANAVGDHLETNNLKWPVSAGLASIVNFSGAKALFLEGGNVKVYSDSTNSLLPKGMAVIPGWSYSLSAEVYLAVGDKTVLSFSEDNLQTESTVKGAWQTLKVSAISGDQNINDLKFSISGLGSTVKMYVRNIQLTPDDSVTGYTNYGANSQPEKIIPAYLESSCYASATDYQLKANAPTICNNFARKCNKAEVGCASYKSAKDGFVIAAKANTADYCRAECANYDTYIARESYFFNTSADNLIPAKTKTCSAQSAGCASFTNLDEISQGGEKQDYYTYIRQCIKPSTTDCGDFYSWEGTSGAGYQLRALSLKKGATGDPALVDANLASACSAKIYYLPPTDPNYNPDCREFYNKNGSITYGLLSNTFSCSDNCHPYRSNEKNIDKNLGATTCSGADKHWDANQSSCYVCKNGGAWNDKYNACLYNSIPDEGTTCTASELGCREYNGNGGEKLRRLASYGFETNLDPFVAKTGTISQSLESTAKDGHSLAYTGGNLEIDAQSLVKKGSAYVIKFMAKAASTVVFNAYLENSDSAQAVFNLSDSNKTGDLSIQGGNSWNLYEINVTPITHDIKTEKLKIKISGAIFIDNFIINEITDRFYLIKGTSQTPDSCSYDIFGTYQGPTYNLGCSLYTDKANIPNYLHRFSELCQDSAAGCEQMVETNNSINPFARTINLSDKTKTCQAGDLDCLSVPGHKITYAVYDATKACLKEDTGCTRFAYSQATASSVNWIDAYKKNLPDNYDATLCQSGEVGCEEWSYGDKNLKSYFKNPGSNVCVYRSGAWFKAAVKRCDKNGDGKITGAEEQAGGICSTNAECGTNKNCLVDNSDYACDVTYLKTIGLGGSGGAIPTPSNRVGLCEAASAGCSEFIDPVSGYMNNVISNPLVNPYNIKPNSLYILNGAATISGISTTDKFRILNKDNNLDSSVSSVTVPNGATSVIFHSGVNSKANITNATSGTTLKEAIINYKINTDLNVSACNGVVDTENGCILFNSRNRGAGPLKFDAAGTAEKSAAKACDVSGINCSANQVIKVRPDRVCSRWLTCTSYIEDPVTKERTCYEMGECDKLNENNECGNVLTDTTPPSVRAIDNSGINSASNWNTLINKNATGYALLNNYYLGSMKEVGQNADAHFDFENSSAILSCKRFDNSACDEKFLKDSLVLEPNGSPTGIDYPAHGKGYLKVLSYYKVSPLSEGSVIYVYGNQDYYINYLVNTTGSADQAKLVITDENGTTIKEFLATTTTKGWERKVGKFKVGTDKLVKKIKIYLTSDTTKTQNSYVYFDDINIEPVLEVAPNQYVAKDCRLYPGADSLTCLSSNNNVIKDGLFGYCLQYDSLNPKSCLMWYPVDKIAPTTRSTQSNLGYNGKFPLYYCAEVNGNFQLTEKIRTFEVTHDWGGPWVYKSSVSDQLKKMLGYTPSSIELNQCYVSNNSQSTTGTASAGSYSSVQPTCGSDNYRLMTNVVTGKHAGARYYIRVFCVPNKNRVLARTGEDNSENKDLYNGGVNCGLNVVGDAWMPYDDKFVSGIVSSSDNGVVATREKTLETINDVAFNGDSKSFSINNLKLLTSNDSANYYHFTCNRFVQLVDTENNNMAWVDRVGRSSKFPTSTPAFFYNIPENFSYSTSASPFVATTTVVTTGNTCSGSSADCSAGQICEGFVAYCEQRNPQDAVNCDFGTQSSCEQSGDCYWNVSPGICSSGSTGTATTNLTKVIYAYGRNREDVPFGAAILPSDYTLVGSQVVNLRNQYSAKNSETILAGRPYGCAGDNCKYIGQCNLNPNIFCIYTSNNELNKQSCASGGGGECAKLWETPLTATSSPNILSTLFIKKYGEYTLNDSAYSNTSSLNWMSPFSKSCPVSGRPGTHPDSFCAVLPTITNPKMEAVQANGSLINTSMNNYQFTVTKNGLYKLSFNTEVNGEQQPLRQIIIDWGDTVQIVTGLDNKPNVSTPHELYHYYINPAPRTIGIRILDNWDVYQGVGSLK